MDPKAITDAPTDVEGLHRYTKVQRATWITQRFGWWLLLALVLAGTAGLFGEGPLSKSSAAGEEGKVEYETILRRDSKSRVSFELAGRSSKATLSLPVEYVRSVEILDVWPQPADVTASPQAHIFSFNTQEGRAFVTMTIQPRHFGRLPFHPRLNGEPVATQRPIVLP